MERMSITNNVEPILNYSEAADLKALRGVCRAMIGEVHKQRGFTKAIPDADLQATAEAWADALRKYSLGEVREMYERAIKDYGDTSIPFGVPQLINAAQAIAAEKRQHITAMPVDVCAGHTFVDGPREPHDPPNIASWRICSNCGSVWAKIKRTAERREP